MTYAVQLPGAQQIATTSTTQLHALGTIVKGVDPTYGEGEFIYLLGVASTAVGSIVCWNATTYQTVLGVTTERVPRPLAVAMSANVAAQYGWYQISGVAVAAKLATTSFAAGAAFAVASTGSGTAIATASGNEVQGALVAAVASAATGRTTVSVLVNRPHLQGRIT
jgi:hypothetical protein